jgi:hypothetical protein
MCGATLALSAVAHDCIGVIGLRVKVPTRRIRATKMRLDEVAATKSIGRVCELASVPNAVLPVLARLRGVPFPTSAPTTVSCVATAASVVRVRTTRALAVAAPATPGLLLVPVRHPERRVATGGRAKGGLFAF